MGEFGTLWRVMPEGERQDKHDASIYSWYFTLCRYAVYNGVVPFVWDTNACHRPSMDILNRKTLSVFNELALKGIMEGCAAVKWPYVTAVESPLNPHLSPLAPHSIFDLEGHRLSQVPERGFYIKDGKKCVKK
jgi:hypothetical protein